nr:hypothetical protein MACL_00001902 [Theileria orientalis]
MKKVKKYSIINLCLLIILKVECIWYLENPNERIGPENGTTPVPEPAVPVGGGNQTIPSQPGQPPPNKEALNSNDIQDGIIVNKTLFGGVHAESDSTFKAVGTGGFRKYDASNALTRGGGYWCSEHDLMNDRIVKWTATLKTSLVLRGVKIYWQYSPSYVSIWVSNEENGQFVQVLPFQSCENVGEEQELIFPKKIRAKYVQIRMKGQVNGYFGITFVQFIGEENPVFRIQSGITSVEDMCLQVDTTGEVVLESCITAISKFEFKDVWRYNNKRQVYSPVSNLCLTLENNVETEGGTLRMLPCKNEKGEDYTDGRNSWTFTSNNQIKMRRPGNLCLSQKGSSAGMANVALNKIAKSNYSILNKEENAAERALDGNAKSYWVSRKFKLEEGRTVDFIIDLQESYKLQTIKVDWHYPALSYNIYTKNEVEWELSKNVGANTLKSTIDYLNDKQAQYIKIEMMKINPKYSDESGYAQYGIGNVAVYTNKLKTIVEPCETARHSKDARDKYFLESVHKLDMKNILPIKKAEEKIEDMVKKIEAKLAEIEKLNAKISKCKNRHESYYNKVEQMKRVYKTSLEKLSQVDVHVTPIKAAEWEKREFTDCVQIKNLGENKPSGFYDITPVCGSEKVRVYCDMYTGSSYYVTMGLSDVVDECAKYGLHPLHIQHEKQVDSLAIMLKTMEVPPGSLFPIAVKVGQTLRSLDLKVDVSKYVSVEDLEEGNVLGVKKEGAEMYDGRDKDMAGVICSTNYSSVKLPEEIPGVGCGTRITDEASFPKKPGSKFKIRCPQNCHETNDNYEVEGGKDGLYSFNSSLCLAAIHAGEYDDKAALQVEIFASPEELDGFYQNGINSASVSTTLGDFAFTIKRVESNCKFKKGKKVVRDFIRRTREKQIKQGANASSAANASGIPRANSVAGANENKGDVNEQQAPKSVQQENKSEPNESKPQESKNEQKDNSTEEPNKTAKDNNTTKDNKPPAPKNEQQQQEEEDETDSYREFEGQLEKVPPVVEVNEQKRRKKTNMMPNEMSTGEAIHSLIEHIYAQNTKGSPIFLDLFRDHTGLVLANTRDLIKKADLKKLPGQSMFVNLNHKVEHMGSSIQLIASQISYRRQMIVQKMEKLMKEKSMYSSFESFALLKTKQESLFSNFVVETTSGSKGSPTWVMSELNVKNSTELTVSQMSQIIPPNNTIAGSYLVLKNRKFFDFIFSTSIYAGSPGSLGVAFRIVDMNNYYLLQLKQSNGGFKRLIRVIDGDPYELARVEDGGFIEEVWYHVRVETRQSRLMISVVQGEDEIFETPKAVIDVIDSTHASGTVALYTGKVSYAHFKRFNVEALSCLRYDSPPLPPDPPFCSIFREDYLSNFSNNWAVYNAKGDWKFDKELMGEERVIVNSMKLGAQEDAEPTIAVLKNHKSCTYGIFTASVLTQCDFGAAGLVFRFHNAGEFLMLELSPKYAALKQMHKGALETLTETNLKGLQLNVWTTFSVTFNDDTMTVATGSPDNSDLLFLNIRASHELKQGGSVGLASVNCTGVAFTNVALKPIYKSGEGAVGAQERSEEDQSSPRCLSVDRKAECEKMAPQSLEACEANFCSHCCQLHYGAKEAQAVCEEQCARQDEKVALVERYLDHLWYNCSSTKFIDKAECEDRDCKANVCGMCCESSKPHESMSSLLNGIAKSRCKNMCKYI